MDTYPEWSSYKWQPDKRISKVLAVSDTVQKALKDRFGVDSEIVPNIYTGPDERRVFLYMSRATKEKGLERTLKLLNMFDRAKKGLRFDYLFEGRSVRRVMAGYRQTLVFCICRRASITTCYTAAPTI